MPKSPGNKQNAPSALLPPRKIIFRIRPQEIETFILAGTEFAIERLWIFPEVENICQTDLFKNRNVLQNRNVLRFEIEMFRKIEMFRVSKIEMFCENRNVLHKNKTFRF